MKRYGSVCRSAHPHYFQHYNCFRAILSIVTLLSIVSQVLKPPRHKSQVRSSALLAVVMETLRQQRVTASGAKVNKKNK